MRLLELGDNDCLRFTEDLTGREVPRYAILSHTWGRPADEVTYQNVLNGAGKTKAGYQKIKLCAEQAKKDHLRHIWVDTCCINKSDLAELSEAINSMFKWFARAQKCYVYLADVTQDGERDTVQLDASLESQLRFSRWFTRGWTLQELLAPNIVEFYSASWTRLGDKASLVDLISDITRIPIQALQGVSLAEFSSKERLSWQDNRRTTRDEDLAYALLGIFDVYMPLIYSEGRQNAYRRLKAEIENKPKDSTEHQQYDFSVSSSIETLLGVEHLVARDSELLEMRKILNSNGSHSSVTLYGVEGVGKSELANVYCVRYREHYSAIFWLDAKDENSIEASFIRAAGQILREHPTVDGIDMDDTDYDPEKLIDAVKAWLALPHNSRWLMVFDGLKSLEIPGNTDTSALEVRNFIPRARHGSILVTTRSPQLGVGSCLEVKKIEDITDCTKILTRASRHETLSADPACVALITKLDGLPLALNTAGSFLNQSSTGLAYYLQCYESASKNLQYTLPNTLSAEARILYTTWQVSFDHIERSNQFSAHLVRLWASFDNQDLWYELLCMNEPGYPAWITELTRSEQNFHSAVGVLCDYGFAEVHQMFEIHPEPIGFSICSSVHDWIRTTVSAVDPGQTQFAVRCIASCFSSTRDAKSWSSQRRLLGHASRCLIASFDEAGSGLGEPFFQLVRLCEHVKRFVQAEEMYKRALEEFEIMKSSATDEIVVASTFHNIGVRYVERGEFAGAEDMFQQAVSRYEKTLGPYHRTTQKAANNFGLACRKQMKLAKAAKIYEHALEQVEKAQGHGNQPLRLLSYNLGIVYHDQGKFEEAENRFRKALKSYERELGPDHIDTLREPVLELGHLYARSGHYAAAAKMYHRALKARGKMLPKQAARFDELGAKLPSCSRNERSVPNDNPGSKSDKKQSIDHQIETETVQGPRGSKKSTIATGLSKTDPDTTLDISSDRQTSTESVPDHGLRFKSRKGLEKVKSLLHIRT